MHSIKLVMDLVVKAAFARLNRSRSAAVAPLLGSVSAIRACAKLLLWIFTGISWNTSFQLMPASRRSLPEDTQVRNGNKDPVHKHYHCKRMMRYAVCQSLQKSMQN